MAQKASASKPLKKVSRRIPENRTLPELRSPESELRFVADNAPVLLAHCDREHRYVFVNRAYGERLGLEPGQIVGKHMTEVIGKAAYEALRPQVERVLKGERVEFELVVPYRDIGQRFIHVVYVPDRDHRGEVHGLLAAITDISDRRKTEEALRISDERFILFMRHLPGAAWMKDMEGRYVYVNETAERIFSLPLSAIRGKTDDDVFPPETAAQFRENDRRAIESAKGIQTIEALPHGDGIHYSVVSKFPIFNPEGRPILVGGIAIDITERQRAEQALGEAQRQIQAHAADLERQVAERTARLQDSMAELESFSYSISHDMRAPLRAMQSFAKILTEEYAERLGHQGTEYLGRIVNAASRMDKLILDVLHYSRVNRTDWTVEQIDIEKLIRGIVESQPAFQQPSAKIVLKGPFPKVLGHEAALTQAVSNLLSNAVKFMPSGQIPRINIWAEPRDEFVRIFFEDNGIGIDPEDYDRIFGIFQRLSTKYEGTGIGLSIVRKAAERMGGRVGLESEPGKGSTFWLDLQQAQKK